jgi:hypothetical protein
MSSCTYDYVAQLKNIRQNFNDKSLRHFQKTAEVVLKGLLISECKERSGKVFDNHKKELKKMIKNRTACSVQLTAMLVSWINFFKNYK